MGKLNDYTQATIAGLAAWDALYGAGGRPDPQHAVEADFNERLAAWQADAAGYLARLAVLYRVACGG